MAAPKVDLLSVSRGMVIAPAGCGKTQLIADAIRDHSSDKPILVLTHTNAGVVALKGRLEKAGLSPQRYRVYTIDGWAIRLISMFPARSGHDPAIVTGQFPQYKKIREYALNLLKAQHINEILAASYSRLFVDEYQDCSIRQHAIVYYAAQALPTCVMGDDMQAIFGFGDDPLAEWDGQACAHFPLAGELSTPWRWINAGGEELGRWLLDIRGPLRAGQKIDLRKAPPSVTWVKLDGGSDDNARLKAAGLTKAREKDGSVLIIGDSTNPAGQRRFASQTPGAVTVESVDLKDLVNFAQNWDMAAPNSAAGLAQFAQELMTNVGAADLIQRLDSLQRGTARKAMSSVEGAALTLLREKSCDAALEFLEELNNQPGVRIYRPAVLHALNRSLQRCRDGHSATIYEAAIYMREQNRLLGRPLPKRAVGSTLLLKGLEAEVAVILNADALNARNLYVAMSRASQNVIICSRTPELPKV